MNDRAMARLQKARGQLMKLHVELEAYMKDESLRDGHEPIAEARRAIADAFGRISTARLRLGYGAEE